jgi:hypothetical protein
VVVQFGHCWEFAFRHLGGIIVEQNRVRAAPNDLPQPPYPGDVPEPELFAPPGGIAVLDGDGVIMWWDGDKLNSLMYAAGLNQYSLADAVGVSQPSINYWIHGQTPSERYIRAIVRVLDIDDIRALFTRDGRAHVLSQAIGEMGRRNGNGRK